MKFFTNVAHAGVISEAPSLASIGFNILNFLLSVVGIIAIISIVVSGLIYLTANGDKGRMQTAKNSFQNSILGIIMAMGAYVLIRVVGYFFE